MSNQLLHVRHWLFSLEKRIRSFFRAGMLLLLCIALLGLTTYAQKQCDQIKLNQVGYYPNSSKFAFITCNIHSEDFYIVSADGTDTVYEGTLGEKRKSSYSSTITRTADFSLLTTAGNYVLRIDDKQSFPFQIRSDVYTDLGRAVLKSFYFQRSSISLDEAYAGQWSRSAKHSGDMVIVRPSSYADNRGSVISSPGGWYDKGDYEKCIVAGGATTSTLLSAYEDFTNYFDTLKTNIPESNDRVPDVLNEIVYNLRWMFTMQDPFDGGVYHRCSNGKLAEITDNGLSKNSEAIEKTTVATLDFAAVMAQAGRIFRRFKTQLPGFADSCLRASSSAWLWALKNPNIVFDQATRKSARSTGEALMDQWLWAASEMFVTSRNRMYFDVVEQNIADSVSLPTPDNVAMLAYYSMLRYADNLPSYASDVVKIMRERLLRKAEEYLGHIPFNAFFTVMGQSKRDFTYGSNGIAANQAILLINAYLATGEERFVSGALTNLDYLLGRNATGYCFVTGCFGTKSPAHPCYRLSDVSAPVPGLLVAGPCFERNKLISLSSSEIETSYQDNASSSDNNQVSIDWNSSMVYLVNALEAMQYELGFSPKSGATIAANR